MPELPEVETIKRGLEKFVNGHIIQSVSVLSERNFIGDPQRVIGSTITVVERKGKGLLLHLDNGYTLAAHVKMTGQFVYRETLSDHPHQHTRIIFSLDKGAYLFYNDIRKFGWIHVVKTDEIQKIPFFKTLGPDPLVELSLEEFIQILKDSTTPIKTFLLDQKKIAGIGNIYANEALFMAGIHPQRKANTVTHAEAESLLRHIQEVLKKSIALGGASEVNFLNVEGKKGHYQNHAVVYAREGQQCFVCKSVISRSKINGRSAFFCAFCQK
jgi:formamidopyrimidine-DNA glycosylase